MRYQGSVHAASRQTWHFSTATKCQAPAWQHRQEDEGYTYQLVRSSQAVFTCVHLKSKTILWSPAKSSKFQPACVNEGVTCSCAGVSTKMRSNSPSMCRACSMGSTFAMPRVLSSMPTPCSPFTCTCTAPTQRLACRLVARDSQRPCLARAACCGEGPMEAPCLEILFASWLVFPAQTPMVLATSGPGSAVCALQHRRCWLQRGVWTIASVHKHDVSA